ncbi:MAG: phosphatidate cytidylyltransferase [Bacteroidota bacterium]
MKSLLPIASALSLFIVVMFLPGCSAIAGIFKAGMWSGIILVALVLLIIVFLFSRGGKK